MAMATEQQRFETRGREVLAVAGCCPGAFTVSSILPTYLCWPSFFTKAFQLNNAIFADRVAAKATEVPCFSCDKDKTHFFCNLRAPLIHRV